MQGEMKEEEKSGKKERREVNRYSAEIRELLLAVRRRNG